MDKLWLLFPIVELSAPDGKGDFLIKDVSITNTQPYATYTLELTEGHLKTRRTSSSSSRTPAKLILTSLTIVCRGNGHHGKKVTDE